MSKISFNVDAYTAKLIGRENVANLDGAILELVKNTYDADASVCLLYYDDIDKVLYIGDNGTGMTSDIISKHWMTIGSSSKKINYKTNKGRVQTGAKGIGRFALDRIADNCSLLTISEYEHLNWSVDWSAFEFGNRITDITADLETVNISFAEFVAQSKNNYVIDFVKRHFSSSGSIFKLTNLRDHWNTQTLNSIRTNLKTLIPPDFREMFNIFMFDNITDLENAAILTEDDSFQHDYKIAFEASEDGKVKVTINRDEFDFGDKFFKIMTEAEFSSADKEYFKNSPILISSTFTDILKSKAPIENTIGNFRGVLYFAKISNTKADREKYYYKDITGRPDIRDSFGGIRIYRDGFRVRPYGERSSSASDWLQLSLRKNKSPAAISHISGSWRVNSDQIHGSVYISRTNMTLPDQANRQGIVETKEFTLLQEFIKNIISLFEQDRQYVSRKLSAYYDKINPIKPIQDELEQKLKEEYKNKAKSQVSNESIPSRQMDVEKVQKLVSKKDDEIKQLETELQMLRVLATTGIITNTYIHEIKGITHRLSSKIKLAKEALELDGDILEGLKYVAQASELKKFFTSWFKVTVEAVRRDKRTLRKVNIGDIVITISKDWQEALAPKGIKIHKSSADIDFKCFTYEIESILNNLIANSATAFDNIRLEEKHIYISIDKVEKGILIKYNDNARGLSQIYKTNPRKILDPFESDRLAENGETIGTGMGMWIINRIVTEYNGYIDLSENITAQQGFYIKIFLNDKR